MAEVTHGELARRIDKVEGDVSALQAEVAGVKTATTAAHDQARENRVLIEQVHTELVGFRAKMEGIGNGMLWSVRAIAAVITLTIAAASVWVATQ